MARGLVKDASLLTGVYDTPVFGVYPYLFKPNQLIFLTQCISQVAGVQGCFVEAGCYRGEKPIAVWANREFDNWPPSDMISSTLSILSQQRLYRC